MNEARKTYSYVWEIENFTLHYHKSGEFVSSPPFIFENLNYSKWYLELFPKGDNSGNADYVSVFLHRDDDEKDEEIVIDYKIEIIDENGEILDTLNESDKVFKGKQKWGSDKFIKREALISKISDWKGNILTLSCELSSKQVDKPYASGFEAKTKIVFIQHSFEVNLDITKSQESFEFHPLGISISFKAPNDDFEMDVYRSANSPIRYRMIAIGVSLLDVKGVKVVSKRNFHVFPNNPSTNYETWKCPSFFSKSMLLNKKDTLLQGNKFTLKFEISFPNGTVNSTIKKYTRNATYLNSDVHTISTLLDNFRDMLVLKKYCDVKLRVESKTIPVHKAVLAARSEVFSTMFDQDMLESKTGIVDIKDMSVNGMNSLLEFMYTGSVKDLDYEKASELLIAADKYQVLSLKEKCSAFLMTVFSESNVCDVLATAEMIGYIPLKTAALDYIKKNCKKVMTSSKWPEWVKMNTILASEIIIQISNRADNVV